MHETQLAFKSESTLKDAINLDDKLGQSVPNHAFLSIIQTIGPKKQRCASIMNHIQSLIHACMLECKHFPCNCPQKMIIIIKITCVDVRGDLSVLKKLYHMKVMCKIKKSLIMGAKKKKLKRV